MLLQQQPQAPSFLAGRPARWLPRLPGCRQVEPPRARKSIGAEVNWGVRFTSEDDAHRFLRKIGARLPACPATYLPACPCVQSCRCCRWPCCCHTRSRGWLPPLTAHLPLGCLPCAATDLQQRMQQAGVKGRSVTLKIMRRKEVRPVARPAAHH